MAHLEVVLEGVKDYNLKWKYRKKLKKIKGLFKKIIPLKYKYEKIKSCKKKKQTNKEHLYNMRVDILFYFILFRGWVWHPKVCPYLLKNRKYKRF